MTDIARCCPIEVLPWFHKNCMEEIKVTVNRTDAFVDPISYIIKSAGSPIHRNDLAPPRYKVGGKWYCSYPELKECHDPSMLPVDEVRIDPVTVNKIGLGKSIYMKEQLEEFAQFQDSQGTRKAYLAETAEIAYIGRNEKGEWGLALGLAAQVSLIDLVGVNFFPLYRVVGPVVFFLSLLLLVWGGLRLFVTVFLRYRGCGVWVWTAFWGTLFQLAVSPFNWIDTVMQDVGRKVGLMLGERGYPGTRSGGDRRAERVEPAEEVPMVAGRSRRGESLPPHEALERRQRTLCAQPKENQQKCAKCGR